MLERQQDVIVIGAGMAGLSAALHLAERGIKPIVLEADPQYPGGRLAGADEIVFQYQGKEWRFRGEHAVHGFWNNYHNLRALLGRNNITPEFSPAREETWIYKFGGGVLRAPAGSAIRSGWWPAPLHYLNLFFRPRFWSMLGISDILRLPFVLYGLFFAVGIDPLKEGQPLEGHTLAPLVRHWGPAVRSFVIGLARNGLSAQPEEIPLSGFLAFLRFYTVLRKDSWFFEYLPREAGTAVIDPMVTRIEEMGGEVRLGQAVSKLKQDVDGWIVYVDGKSLRAETVILATDSYHTRQILEDSSLTSGLESDLYWPKTIKTAVVRIWFDNAPQRDSEAGMFSGEFSIDNFFWLHRLFWPYFEWHRDTGGSAVEVHIYGPPEMLAEEDASLLARAINDVNAAYPELRGHRVHQQLVRHPATHTLFGVGPPERHLGTHTQWNGLYCAGDWVRHPHPSLFLERATVTGIAAANVILAEKHLEVWPIREPEPPEIFARFLQSVFYTGRRILTRNKR